MAAFYFSLNVYLLFYIIAEKREETHVSPILATLIAGKI
jgi:hypothetical protein